MEPWAATPRSSISVSVPALGAVLDSGLGMGPPCSVTTRVCLWIASANGAIPTGVCQTTWLLVVSMATTELLTLRATYARVPWGLNVIPQGKELADFSGLGRAISRILAGLDGSEIEKIWMAFWALVTHISLD